MIRRSIGTLVGFAAALAAMPVDAAQPSADLILSNAHIRMLGGWAESLAIRDGAIVAVGTDAAVAKWRTQRTRVVELGGKTVMPGLHDMHVHPLPAGLMITASCFIPPGSNLERVQATVRQCATKRQRGEWIVGGDIDPALPLTRHELDSAAPDNPVVLTQIGNHTVYASSRALALSGIDKSASDPGGLIARDAAGEPTGVLFEAATWQVRSHVPPPTRADNLRALAWALDQLLSLGVTSLTDAALGADGLQAYDDLSDAGRLKQRVRACVVWQPGLPAAAAPNIVDPIAGAAQYARPRLAPTCVKFMLDGIPGPARTAALLEPYAPAPGRPAGEHGALNIPLDVLSREVTRFDRAGLTAKFHATGDAAAREALDAIQAARNANGMRGPHHEIAHSQMIEPSDIARARALGVTLEFSPVFWGVPAVPANLIDSMMSRVTDLVGAPRVDRYFPVKEALDAGVLAVGGTDWPTTPPNPWPAIESLVTRWALIPIPGVPAGAVEGDPPLQARERISLEQAIDLYTSAPARQLGLSKKEGSIARGYWADLVVLDRDPFAIPITQVHQTKVLMTLINGEIVYDRSSPTTGEQR